MSRHGEGNRLPKTSELWRAAFSIWWDQLTREGDPLHIPNKFSVAFKAGWRAAKMDSEGITEQDVYDTLPPKQEDAR
jgi:hypothetical protein